MALTTHLDIVSAESAIFSGRVEMVVVVGALGEMGILPEHAALLTHIKPGPVRIIKQGGEEEVFYVSGGMLEVQPSSVTVLADTVIRADNLDETKALAARQRAEKMFAEKKTKIDFSLALVQLAQASAELRTIKLARRNGKKKREK